jgi:hypothetical protein
MNDRERNLVQGGALGQGEWGLGRGECYLPLTSFGACRSGSRAAPPPTSGGGFPRRCSRRRRPSDSLAAAVACEPARGARGICGRTLAGSTRASIYSSPRSLVLEYFYYFDHVFFFLRSPQSSLSFFLVQKNLALGSTFFVIRTTTPSKHVFILLKFKYIYTKFE